MKHHELMVYYQSRNLSLQDYNYDVSAIKEMELIMNDSIDNFSLKMLDDAIEILYQTKKLSVDFFYALMRYMRMIKRHDLFIRLIQYTGGIDVIESILNRLEKVHGLEKKELLLNRITLPKLGIKPEKVISFTETFMNTLHTLFSPQEIKTIITGNNHLIPATSFKEDVILYESCDTLESFLKLKHDQMIETLTLHYKENKVWFEQRITEDVIRYIASDQELLSARLYDNTLFLRKIPYDIDGFLKTNDALQKRYLTCHCPFAREAILNQKVDISPLWCYCSAGFEKNLFETILNHPLKIRVLKSVLNGDEDCRFAISLEGIPYKK